MPRRLIFNHGGMIRDQITRSGFQLPDTLNLSELREFLLKLCTELLRNYGGALNEIIDTDGYETGVQFMGASQEDAVWWRALSMKTIDELGADAYILRYAADVFMNQRPYHPELPELLMQSAMRMEMSSSPPVRIVAQDSFLAEEVAGLLTEGSEAQLSSLPFQMLIDSDTYTIFNDVALDGISLIAYKIMLTAQRLKQVEAGYDRGAKDLPFSGGRAFE